MNESLIVARGLTKTYGAVPALDCVFPVSVDTVVFGEGIGRIDIQSYQILTETFYLR